MEELFTGMRAGLGCPTRMFSPPGSHYTLKPDPSGRRDLEEDHPLYRHGDGGSGSQSLMSSKVTITLTQ